MSTVETSLRASDVMDGVRQPAKARTSAGGMRVTFVEPGDTGPYRDAWADLADRAIEFNPLCRPEFVLPAIRELAPGAVQMLFIHTSRGRMVGAAPVVRRRLGFGFIGKNWAIWSHSFGPLSTPLIDGTALAETAAAICEALGGGAAIAFANQNLDGPVASALRRHLSGRRPAPVVLGVHERALLDNPLTSTQHRLEALSSRRRRKLKQKWGYLSKLGALTVTQARGGDGADVDFRAFCDLEASGWKGDRGTALSSKQSYLSLASDAVTLLADAGKSRIFTLRLDGRPIAMALTFQDGGDAFVWKIAYDECLGQYSPGVILMQELTDRFLDDPEVKRVDSLADPNHPLINHLWRERRKVGMIVARGRLPGVFYKIAVADIKLHGWARRNAIDILRRLKRRLRG